MHTLYRPIEDLDRANHTASQRGRIVTALEHEHEGVWAGVLPVAEVPDYRLVVAYDGVEVGPQDDAYRFLPTLGEIDLHLINEGRHENLWQVLGARV